MEPREFIRKIFAYSEKANLEAEVVFKMIATELEYPDSFISKINPKRMFGKLFKQNKKNQELQNQLNEDLKKVLLEREEAFNVFERTQNELLKSRQNLSHTKKTLQENLNKTKSELDELERQTTKLKEELSKYQLYKETLSSNQRLLKTEEDRIIQIKDDIEKSKKEFSRVKAEGKSVEGKLNNINNTVKSQERKISSVQKEYRNAEKKLSLKIYNYKTEKKGIEGKLQPLEDNIINLQNEISKIKEKKIELETQQKELQNTRKQLDKKNKIVAYDNKNLALQIRNEENKGANLAINIFLIVMTIVGIAIVMYMFFNGELNFNK
jgi:chromosome segregation ATPase